MTKHYWIFVLDFVELCACIIPNASNGVFYLALTSRRKLENEGGSLHFSRFVTYATLTVRSFGFIHPKKPHWFTVH